MLLLLLLGTINYDIHRLQKRDDCGSTCESGSEKWIIWMVIGQVGVQGCAGLTHFHPETNTFLDPYPLESVLLNHFVTSITIDVFSTCWSLHHLMFI